MHFATLKDGNFNSSFLTWFALYAGLGIRFRHITTVNQEFDKNRDAMLHSRHPNVNDMGALIDAEGGNSVALTLLEE